MITRCIFRMFSVYIYCINGQFGLNVSTAALRTLVPQYRYCLSTGLPVPVLSTVDSPYYAILRYTYYAILGMVFVLLKDRLRMVLDM